MRSRLSSTTLIAGSALLIALALTIFNPSKHSLFDPLDMKYREVAAAPGQPMPAAQRHDLAGLQVFNVTLVRIRDAYVDPGRISPKGMLYAALDSVQFNVPEVLVEPYPDRDEVVVVVNDKRQKFSTSEVDSPWRLAGKLKRVFRFIEANMNPGADLADVEYSAVNGMLRTLDPHSVLLDPETAREMDVSTSGKFGGLGIVIRMVDGKLTVQRPMKGTPAMAAGVKNDHRQRFQSQILAMHKGGFHNDPGFSDRQCHVSPYPRTCIRAFNSSLRACSTGSVYPDGCTRPRKTRSQAA